MAPLHLSVGDSLVLWVQDRTGLPSPTPLGELQKGLTSIGLACEVRALSGLARYELVLAPKGNPPPSAFHGSLPSGHDAFAILSTGNHLRLISATWRGWVFGVWELMESFGWSWPTPEVTREPEVSAWLFEEDKQVHRGRMAHRILFLEQVEITPEIVLWLSRQRINSLFPSNPARFNDPENQFSDQSVARAQGLGFDLMVGGEALDWLLEQHQVGGTRDWESLTAWEEKAAFGSLCDVLREMEDPRPRLSLWPAGQQPSSLVAFLQRVLEKFPHQALETHLSLRSHLGPRLPMLYHLREESSSPFTESELLQWKIEEELGTGTAESVYLFFDASRWDDRLGRGLDAFFWRRQYLRLSAAFGAGLDGMAVSLHDLDLGTYLERGAFALSALARGMWEGPTWDPRPYVRDRIHQQFEAAGPIVETLTHDFERWADQLRESAVAHGSPYVETFQRATEILGSESVRDKLDQRISEIEESAPCGTCLELAKSLSTLVGLFDLEESSDSTEAKAMARTLWRNNQVDKWPAWLRDTSPFVERLKAHL